MPRRLTCRARRGETGLRGQRGDRSADELPQMLLTPVPDHCHAKLVRGRVTDRQAGKVGPGVVPGDAARQNSDAPAGRHELELLLNRRRAAGLSVQHPLAAQVCRPEAEHAPQRMRGRQAGDRRLTAHRDTAKPVAVERPAEELSVSNELVSFIRGEQQRSPYEVVWASTEPMTPVEA